MFVQLACSHNRRYEHVFVFHFQRGNPILKFVRSVPWEFGDVVPDYVLGQTTCALFLRCVLGPMNI